MLKSLLRFEESVAHYEGRLLTILVTLMLALAVYNVFYRNALVPVQASILTPETTEASESPAAAEPAKSETEDQPDEGADEAESEANGFGGGFGGGFDEAEKGSDDDAEGFGGGFDDTAEDPQEPEESADDASGFGGDFDEGADDSDDTAEGFGGGFDDGADDSEGFGGGFDDEKSRDSAAVPPAQTEPVTVTLEPELSGFERFVVDTIDALKIEWIDVLLRQLVLIVGFLGGMLATRRRKHITIDALTKVIPEKSLPWVGAFTSLLSAVICVFLAVAGWDLVKISLEYPKELMSWADESTFQMVFPVGFGLLTFHFALRVLVYVGEIITGEDADAVLGGEA